MNIESNAPDGAMNAADEIIGRPLRQGLADSVAILCGERSISFAELNAEVNRCGHALRAQGVQRGDRVLFLMDDSPELVGAYLGTMRIGAVAVALNVRLAARDLSYIIEHSECRVICVDAHFLDLYQSAAAALQDLPVVVQVGGEARAAPGRLRESITTSQPTQLESVMVDPDEVGFWLYSSGTTGKPKAVMHPHRTVRVADCLERECLGVGPGDRVFTTSKIFFGFALGHSLMGGIQCGATIILSPAWPEPKLIIDTVERHQPTVLFSTPVMYRNLLREGAPMQPGLPRHPPLRRRRRKAAGIALRRLAGAVWQAHPRWRRRLGDRVPVPAQPTRGFAGRLIRQTSQLGQGAIGRRQRQ
jgi:acyl-coenzyme A synthetase/AMP-(fatty) acid ligase